MREMVSDSSATWVHAAVVVDALTDSRLRQDLNVRALLSSRQLPRVPDRAVEGCRATQLASRVPGTPQQPI